MVEQCGRTGENDGRPVLWMPLVRDAVADALAVAFPVDCAGCGLPDRGLCAGCATGLLALPDVSGELHRQILADGTVVVSALRYEGESRAAILAFKEHGRTDIAGTLARALRSAVEEAVAGATPAVEVCPIPASRISVRRRGYRPVELLVQRARLKPARVLTVTKPTIQQKSLGLMERERNLHGSFRPKAPLPGRRFVLVDDIVTTGATLIEAARAITSGGGEVIAAATLAYTPRRIPLRARFPVAA